MGVSVCSKGEYLRVLSFVCDHRTQKRCISPPRGRGFWWTKDTVSRWVKSCCVAKCLYSQWNWNEEWDKGGIGMRLTFIFLCVCVCVCVGDHQTCRNGESKSVRCTIVHHQSLFYQIGKFFHSMSRIYTMEVIQWRPSLLFVQYFQEANLAYSSKKEQAELLQKVRHTLSSDCWLGHSSIALCAGVGCLRCWRWWGRSSSNGIQTTGTSSIISFSPPASSILLPFPSFDSLSFFLSQAGWVAFF